MRERERLSNPVGGLGASVYLEGQEGDRVTFVFPEGAELTSPSHRNSERTRLYVESGIRAGRLDHTRNTKEANYNDNASSTRQPSLGKKFATSVLPTPR